MEAIDQYKEACDLLRVWFHIQSKGLVWQDAVAALEHRINELTKGVRGEKGECKHVELDEIAPKVQRCLECGFVRTNP
jgi:hypothetical protein